MLTMRPATTPDTDLVLKTIRTLESGGNYSAKNGTSSASGAYQYVDSTWNGFGGYAHAKDAPASIQDARARQDVLRILQTHNQDIRAVPQFWYYPAGYGKPDLVPPGNTLSMGQYTERWMRIYNSLGGTSGGATGSSSIGPAATGTSGVQLASATSAGDGTFKEHCVLKLPGVSLGPVDVGGNCLLSSNQARALAGGFFVAAGAVVMLLGVALLTKGSVVGAVTGIPMKGVSAVQNRREDRQFARAEEQGRLNKANAPMVTAGGRKMLGTGEEPF